MSEQVRTARAFIDALERDPDEAAGYLVDGFTFTGAVPAPLSKGEFLAFARVVQRAFPDWHYDVRDVVEDRESVRAKVQLSGTQQGELALPYAEPIPPTGRRVDLPQETLEFTFDGAKISRLRLAELVDGGAPDVVSQLTS